ncbi:MAG: caspase family protein [Saprospiraceae bacterium]
MKLPTIILLFFFGFSINASAGCIKGNCKNGKGVLISHSGDRYEGNFKNNNLTGKGKWKSKSGDRYRGEFVNGRIEGKGKMTFTNGDYYIGEFVNGQFQGRGKYTYANGQYSIGSWINGKIRQESNTNNTTFVDNKSENNNNSYTNTTINNNEGAPIGFANITKDCTMKNCHNELGVYNYSDGSRYLGQFMNGSPKGEGRCEYFNGDLYEGSWALHAPHGKGVMTFSSGKKYAAIWDYGNPKEQLLEDINYVPKINSNKPKFSEEVNVYALVVGVASYQHLSSLKYTDDDAYQVYAFLKSPEGGAIPNDNIKVLIDDVATKNNILMSMEQLFSKADANDVVLLYLSGHGFDGAFVPSDFDGYKNQLPYNDIMNVLQKSDAKYKLAIADACHSGSIVNNKGIDYAPALESYYNILEDLDNGGTALLLSSAASEVSLEYSGLRQGVFSHYLMNGLKGAADSNQNKVVTLTELYGYIYSNVRNYTANKQSPILTGNFNGNMPVAVIR